MEFHPKLFKRAEPGEGLDYYIYKHIPEGIDKHEEQIRSILETAPILPGQAFTEKFSIPAYKKHEIQKN